jgi:hypothetical protein
VLKLRISERSRQRAINCLRARFVAANSIPFLEAGSSQQKPKIFADEVVPVFIYSELALEFWKYFLIGDWTRWANRMCEWGEMPQSCA